MKRWIMNIVLLFALLAGASMAQAEALGKLLYFSNALCGYCRIFERDISQVYPKTASGQKLPIIEVDLLHPGPYETLAKSICFTPTFVVLDQSGGELSRFRGYRGEEFFWMEVEGAIKKLEGAGR